ncbi:hypothetical protein MSG28_011449, partial [Choristoneura fumiferana]
RWSPTRVKLEWLVWRRRYIATQGPTPHTLDAFWRMIWQHKVHTVVMITNLVERGRRKCDMYWPGGGRGSSAEFGGVHVTLLHEDESSPPSPLSEEDAAGRMVVQYHYTVWPDHGTPRHPLAVLPAGVGRTGTYIVLDAQLNQLKLTGTLSPLGFLCRARTQRNHLVQTEEQYVFVHDALLEHVRSGNTEVPFTEAREYLVKLLQPISEDELAVLDLNPPKHKSINDLTNGIENGDTASLKSSKDETDKDVVENGSQLSIKTDDLNSEQSKSVKEDEDVKEVMTNGDESEGVYDLGPRSTDTYSKKMQAYNNMTEQEKEELRRIVRAPRCPPTRPASCSCPSQASKHPPAGAAPELWRLLWDHTAQLVLTLAAPPAPHPPAGAAPELWRLLWDHTAQLVLTLAAPPAPHPPAGAAPELWRLLWDHTAQLVLTLAAPPAPVTIRDAAPAGRRRARAVAAAVGPHRAAGADAGRPPAPVTIRDAAPAGRRRARAVAAAVGPHRAAGADAGRPPAPVTIRDAAPAGRRRARAVAAAVGPHRAAGADAGRPPAPHPPAGAAPELWRLLWDHTAQLVLTLAAPPAPHPPAGAAPELWRLLWDHTAQLVLTLAAPPAPVTIRDAAPAGRRRARAVAAAVGPHRAAGADAGRPPAPHPPAGAAPELWRLLWDHTAQLVLTLAAPPAPHPPAGAAPELWRLLWDHTAQLVLTLAAPRAAPAGRRRARAVAAAVGPHRAAGADAGRPPAPHPPAGAAPELWRLLWDHTAQLVLTLAAPPRRTRRPAPRPSCGGCCGTTRAAGADAGRPPAPVTIRDAAPAGRRRARAVAAAVGPHRAAGADAGRPPAPHPPAGAAPELWRLLWDHTAQLVLTLAAPPAPHPPAGAAPELWRLLWDHTAQLVLTLAAPVTIRDAAPAGRRRARAVAAAVGPHRAAGADAGRPPAPHPPAGAAPELWRLLWDHTAQLVLTLAAPPAPHPPAGAAPELWRLLWDHTAQLVLTLAAPPAPVTIRDAAPAGRRRARAVAAAVGPHRAAGADAGRPPAPVTIRDAAPAGRRRARAVAAAVGPHRAAGADAGRPPAPVTIRDAAPAGRRRARAVAAAVGPHRAAGADAGRPPAPHPPAGAAPELWRLLWDHTAQLVLTLAAPPAPVTIRDAAPAGRRRARAVAAAVGPHRAAGADAGRPPAPVTIRDAAPAGRRRARAVAAAVGPHRAAGADAGRPPAPDCETFWPTEDEKELFVANFRASFVSKDTYVAYRKSARKSTPAETPAEPETNGYRRQESDCADDERLIPENGSPVADTEPAYRFDRTELRLERLSAGNRDLSTRKSIANGDLFSSFSEKKSGPKSPRSPSKMSLKNFKLSSPTKFKFPDWGSRAAGSPPDVAPPPPPVAPSLTVEEEAELRRPFYRFEKVDKVPENIPSDRVIEVTNVSVHSLQDDYQLSVKFIQCSGWLEGDTTEYCQGKPDENEFVRAVREATSESERAEAVDRLIAPYKDSFALIEFVAGCQMEYKNGPAWRLEGDVILHAERGACGGARAPDARAQFRAPADDRASLYTWGALCAHARCSPRAPSPRPLLAQYCALAAYHPS